MTHVAPVSAFGRGPAHYVVDRWRGPAHAPGTSGFRSGASLSPPAPRAETIIGVSEHGDLYVAVLVNEITVDNPGHVASFEESIVLLRADSEEDAERIALAYAHDAETSYLNVDGETVRWRFRRLSGLSLALDENLDPQRLRTGTEIFSRFFSDLDAYDAVDGDRDAARWSPGLQE